MPRIEPTEAESLPLRAFYTLGDASYFLGVVALINSLRLLEHSEPVFVLDCGFTERQRMLLRAEATLVPLAGVDFPPLGKAIAPLLHPARQMILIDSDVIVLRRLSRLVEPVTEGRVVAFADPVSQRHDPRWSMLLGLPDVRRHPYVNAGFLAFSDASLPLLEEFHELCRRAKPENSIFGSAAAADPFYYLDQDILNALLGTRVDAEDLIVHEQRLAPHPPFRGLQFYAAQDQRHAYADATEPFLLHYAHPRKPWLAHTRSSVFTRRFCRLVIAPDLALKPPIGTVPWRLRTGARASFARANCSVRGRVADSRGRLGIRRRLDRRTTRPSDAGIRADQSHVDPKGA